MFKIVVVLCCLIACSLGASISSKINQIEPGRGSRIVGGQNGTINQFPYQVSVQTYGGHSCGGSLYLADCVVTAAHCLRFTSPNDIQIRAGSTNKNKGGSLVDVSHFKVHPNYEDKTKLNDIALIFLKAPLTLGDNIQTIDLATSTPKDGTPGVVSGWGTESFYKKDPAPEYLKYANLKVVSRENCISDKYAYGEKRIFANMICAIGDGEDSCQGDSGGPFVIDRKLAGVISWGFGCAETMFPGVYTSIPMLSDWIKSNV